MKGEKGKGRERENRRAKVDSGGKWRGGGGLFSSRSLTKFIPFRFLEKKVNGTVETINEVEK